MNQIITPVQTQMPKSEVVISPDKEEKSDTEQKIHQLEFYNQQLTDKISQLESNIEQITKQNHQLEAEVLKSRESFEAIKNVSERQTDQIKLLMEQMSQMMERLSKVEEQNKQKDHEIARLKEGQK